MAKLVVMAQLGRMRCGEGEVRYIEMAQAMDKLVVMAQLGLMLAQMEGVCEVEQAKIKAKRLI
jgi:hypothetical protein